MAKIREADKLCMLINGIDSTVLPDCQNWCVTVYARYQLLGVCQK